MRIAVIGSGIAGHSAALALKLAPEGHDIVLYEKSPVAGGHAATVDILHHGLPISVDTGFIVYNELNYPNLSSFFKWAEVATQASDMSFSVSANQGQFEWCGRDGKGVLSGLFAQKRNLLSPSFLNMLREIGRFQKVARRDLAHGTIGEGTLDAYLARYGFGARLKQDYLLPMGAAIWSTSDAAMREFPAQSFIAFFENHCLLQWKRPRWRTVRGGSIQYVRKMAAMLGNSLRLATEVVAVRRVDGGVEVQDDRGNIAFFDKVIIATHAPQALAMLQDASALEREILGPVHTCDNDVYLHCDTRLMPKRPKAWAAWNFLREDGREKAKVAVTYWMNRLQNIDADHPLFITLNPPVLPRAETIFGHYTYAHPQFDVPALQALQRLPEIQGQNHIYFCGAWTGHGFHEDGMASGLKVAAMLGASPPWQAHIARPQDVPHTAAFATAPQMVEAMS
ncbi:MAG: FAD-dependent oxidoreductase [Hyphomicrobiales bacterium]|nr:FAD-dependent oxidoreductase [Hyphomicrobiales bacterium]MDE2113967.1 FAD-dependent oxidoreductase [Hyphomicrobiales bacterium]